MMNLLAYKPAAPAEAPPDPIADLAYGVAVLLLAELAALRVENAEQLAKRDAEIEALRADAAENGAGADRHDSLRGI